MVTSSDFFQDKDTFILIVQDSGTLGIELALCTQLWGTRFLSSCDSCHSAERFWFSILFLIPIFIYLCLVRPKCDKSYFSANMRWYCVLLESEFTHWNIYFQVYQLFIFTNIWACYFINDRIPGWKWSAFSPFNFYFKKLCQLNSTSVLWFSKLVLLYGRRSVKFDILKHVSLWLNMISQCYFYLYFAFGMAR